MNRNKRNKRFAKLGDNAPGENIAMLDRATRFRVGNVVELSPWFKYLSTEMTEFIGSNNLGVVTDAHPYGWDYVVYFGGTRRRGGSFAFFESDLKLVKR